MGTVNVVYFMTNRAVAAKPSDLVNFDVDSIRQAVVGRHAA